VIKRNDYSVGALQGCYNIAAPTRSVLLNPGQREKQVETAVLRLLTAQTTLCVPTRRFSVAFHTLLQHSCYTALKSDTIPP
jgi:hypothetical protein